MPYVLIIERIAHKEGIKQGMEREGQRLLIQTLNIKFEAIPTSLINKINSMDIKKSNGKGGS